MSKNWFDIDNTGWKRMNAGRPPYELVKELIQNILDEDFRTAFINYSYKNDAFILSIEDDVNGGIQDSSLITTVFMTGKEDSHLKRGRKGRGLKEFLSVCYSAIVETVGKTVEFCADGTRKEYSNNRIQGTMISCVIKEEGWDKKTSYSITKFIERIIFEQGDIIVNGNKLEKRVYEHVVISCLLDTQVIVNGLQKEIAERTNIGIYPMIGKKGWLYEMGIPVVETDIPYDIDIRQRIPLNDNRNEVSFEYLENVKHHLIRGLLSSLTKSDLLGWASVGLSNYWNFSFEQQKDITYKIIGNSIHLESTVIKTDKRMDDKAKQRGYNVLDISSMNRDLQYIMKTVLKSSDTLIKDIEQQCVPIIVEANEIEKSFIEKHKQIVKGAIGLDIEINIVEKPKDLVNDLWVEAFYDKGTPSVLSYNRLALSQKLFSNPYSPKALEILFHELGHEESYCHDDFKYLNAVTFYASKIAVYLMSSYKGEKVKREKGSTLKEDIVNILKDQGYYMKLNDIYFAMNANTNNAKAGIRSILNRECLNEGSLFERHISGGEYRLRSI